MIDNIQISTPTSASNLDDFYTQLNTIRKNHNLSSIFYSNRENMPTMSNDMVTLNGNLNSTAKQSKYLKKHNLHFSLTGINVAAPTQINTVTQVKNALTTMNNICAHDGSDYNSNRSHDSSDDSHHGTVHYGQKSHKGHDSSDKNHGDVSFGG